MSTLRPERKDMCNISFLAIQGLLLSLFDFDMVFLLSAQWAK